ncbi:HAMP domain-containing sensor histidine kinase [Planococcus donghaensis]|uniref:histidine kinase n=1 Tax=Planococcus donghaensis TaxID=414778 RepID=A0A1C7EHB0_9BACL|nr:HAMP domain-containing sensor histidine kinase [Planococcus donghaensis]ANU23051.1 hypothetical protein BCM40_06550 [Planococcus donghaensis]
MRKIGVNKLLLKLFFVILLNWFLASCVFFLLAYFAARFYFQEGASFNPEMVNRVYPSILFLSILVFIIGFSFMVRHKLKQISHLAQEIDAIASGNLGHQVVIKGNDELASLGENVNRMSVQIKELFEKERSHEQEHRQLTSNLSHDLRTPLTSIRGYVQLLQDYPGKHDQAYLHIIEKKTKQLERLVDQLSAVDRLSDGQITMHAESINLSLMTSQLIHEYHPLFEMDGMQLVPDIESALFVSADVEGVMRTCQNLLSNALKYAQKNSTVRIDVRQDQEKETIVWEIRNETDEATLQQLDKLFNRTYRVDPSRGAVAGDGLGLSIARQIMRLNGGDLIVKQAGKHTISFQAIFPSIGQITD